MAKKNLKGSGFVFQDSYLEAVEELDDETQKAEIIQAIVYYGIYGEVDFEKLSTTARALMKLIMPQISSQKEKYKIKSEAGKKGGQTEKQTESKTQANEKQTESKTQANGKQTESKTQANEKQNENLLGYNNNINNINNNILFVNENTHNEIKKYFFEKGFSEDVAKRFENYNLDHNKKIPTDWQHYADKFLENEKLSTSKQKLLTYQDYQSLIVSGRNKAEDFEKIQLPNEKPMWKLKTA